MRIGNTILDIENLSLEGLETLIKAARRIRVRKEHARDINATLHSLVSGAKEINFSICSKYTGEVLNPDDWVIYDNAESCIQEGEWET